MLAPGCTITSGRVSATAAANPTPSAFSNGVGFASGAVSIATDAIPGPDTDTFLGGIRRTLLGAFRGTTSTAGTDVYMGGLRVSATGLLVYAPAGTVAAHVNGNPINSSGVLVTT